MCRINWSPAQDMAIFLPTSSIPRFGWGFDGPGWWLKGLQKKDHEGNVPRKGKKTKHFPTNLVFHWGENPQILYVNICKLE